MVIVYFTTGWILHVVLYLWNYNQYHIMLCCILININFFDIHKVLVLLKKIEVILKYYKLHSFVLNITSTMAVLWLAQYTTVMTSMHITCVNIFHPIIRNSDNLQNYIMKVNSQKLIYRCKTYLYWLIHISFVLILQHEQHPVKHESFTV